MFFRILQQERLHPVPAPIGLHHLKHVANGGRAGDTGDYYIIIIIIFIIIIIILFQIHGNIWIKILLLTGYN